MKNMSGNLIKGIFAILLFSAVTQASVLNLNPGDSVTLDANSQTTVTCGSSGSSSSCADSLSAFQSLLKACEQNEMAGMCMDKMWPQFKHSYPNCVAMAVQTCLDACEQNYLGDQCAVKCQ